MKTLTLGDELFDPAANCLAMQVTSPTLTLGRVRVLEANADAERWIPYEEIRSQIDLGQLEIRRKGVPALAVFLDREDSVTCKRKGSRRSVSSAVEDSYLSSLARATNIVRRLNDYCSRYKVNAYSAYPAVRKEFESECSEWVFPSMATVYRMLERDKCRAPLVMPNKMKGNRSERHCQEVQDLICRLAQETFLKEGSPWTLNELADKSRRTAIAMGLLGAAGSLSKKFVRKVIVTKLHAMPEVARLLGKDRAAKASVASHRIRVDGIFQRVEQDAVNMPFVIQTPDGICSDVWLVHAIDCASSSVVGWHLKIGAPNESDGLRCVESTVFSKEAKFNELGISDAYDLYGTPGLLVLDNGAEARGSRMRRLTQLGIDIVYCKSRHPQLKPYIERLNRSLKEALQTLPGCTRLNNEDGKRDPVALGDNLMDLAELERWIVRWYQDKWADTVLERFVDQEAFEDRGLGVTPRQRYTNIVERLGHPLPLPPNRGDWIRTKYNAISRTLSMKTGITVESHDFRGDNLQRLIKRFGQASVDVLYDPDDFRRVYVLDGAELVELQNQAANEFTPGHSFSKAKTLKSAVLSQHPETPRSASFTEAVYKKSMEGAGKPLKSAKSPSRASKKEVVELTRAREAFGRAAQSPITPSTFKGATLNAPLAIQLDDVDDLSPRDRKTGALL